MTTISEGLNDISTEQEPQKIPVLTKLQQFSIWAASFVEKANPILVKETRQALKSRQFVITFLVVLIACWIASFAVIAIIGPSVFYAAEGSRMLLVYCMILAFPLILIVPYSAFRSLAVEQEDNTYELLSITTLSSSQIITGKLGSAIVQMLIYFSAVSPCIAFTFLLRGVDALTVIVLLIYFFMFSIGLSMIALLAGTMSKIRYMQSLLSVLLVLCLGFIYFNVFEPIEEFIRDSALLVQEKEFWIFNLVFMTFFLTTFAILHAAAASQIAFNSENRSSRIRYLLVLQHACILGWIFAEMIIEAANVLYGWVVVGMTISSVYWYSAGVLMTSEWPHLSRRVQRSLPDTNFGRTLFTWFNPGPGTGFMFCVANLSMVLLLSLAWIVVFHASTGGLWQLFVIFLMLSWSYVVLYLGLGRILICIARQFTFVSLAAGFLLHFILLLVGCGAPQIIQYISSRSQFRSEYSLIHMSNPFWTLMDLIDRGLSYTQSTIILIVICTSSLIVYLINIKLLSREMHYHKAKLPLRIIQDDVELHPVNESKQASPWEEAT